ncbi:MAG: zf-HC2 domain-containing protein [Pseudomonadales bacterium]
MNCPTELIRFRYADGACSEDEAAELEQHLAGCAACSASVEALATERQVLRSALQTMDAPQTIPAFSPRPRVSPALAGVGWAALLAWVVNVAWETLSASRLLPDWLSWLTPDSGELGFDLTIGLLLTLLLQFANGDSSALDSVITAARNIVLGAIGLAGICWFLVRRKGQPAATLCLQLCLLAGFLTAAVPGHAFVIRGHDDRVTVPAGETIDDTLLVHADNILIEGTVTGDLIAFGERVTVRGVVGGNLLVGGEELDIEGQVSGSVISFGEKVTIRSTSLGGNLFGAGETLTLHSGARVAGNAFMAGREVDVQGVIERDLLAGTEHLDLLGSVDGNLSIYARSADLADSARVGGDLTGKLERLESLVLADGALVAGTTRIDVWPEEPSRYLNLDYYLGQTVLFLATLASGLVLFALFPALRSLRIQSGAELLIAAGFGAVTLIATPVLAVVAVVTLIGAPLGIATFLLWLMCLYAAIIVVASFIGNLLLAGRGPATDNQARVLPLLMGLVIVFVLINLPFLGGPLRLLTIVVGLGLIVQQGFVWWRARPV